MPARRVDPRESPAEASRLVAVLDFMGCLGRLLTLWRPAFGYGSLEPKLAGVLPLRVAAKAALSWSHRQAAHQSIGRSAGSILRWWLDGQPAGWIRWNPRCVPYSCERLALMAALLQSEFGAFFVHGAVWVYW